MRYRLQGLRLVRKFSSIIALALGGYLLYIFVQRGFWSIVGPLAGFTIGALITTVWMVIQSKQGEDNRQSVECHRLPIQVPIILTSLFIILMIGIFRFSLYQRPVAQYVLFGGFAGFIGYQIAGGATRRRIVPQILVLAFLTYWSGQFLFPAGMYAMDTYYAYIPKIEGILTSGYYENLGAYMGHLIHTGMFATITGFAPQTAYFVLATTLLTGTILVLSILDRALTIVSEQVTLFAALVFSISSWTIGRGMHPNKLNFFYPLIVLFGITAIQLYQSSRLSGSEIRRWSIIGLISIPAVVFGHRFSAGAALLLLFAFLGHAVITWGVLAEEYDIVPQVHLGLFVATYFLAVIGNPLHQGAL
ncbi:MAG: hypothetical protein ABEI86_03535, partial [Halobacteriaceae archaeon]